MKKLFLLSLFSFISAGIFAQSISVQNAIPSTISSLQSPVLGDILISANEPIGPMSGVQKADGTLYLAVNDTLSTSNLGLIIFQSTNLGSTWTLFPQGIASRNFYPRVKMFVTPNDSVYCFFLNGGNIYRWNIISGSFSQYDALANTLDFDVVAASNNYIFMFWNNSSNAIKRVGSTDGGSTWATAGTIVSSGCSAPVRAYISATGDTIVVNYRNGFGDTSAVKAWRYRLSTVPGVLQFIGTSQDVLPLGAPRSEFQSVFRGSSLWFFYAEGVTGGIDIKCKLSTDNGVTFGTPFNVAGNPNTDEYWFDAKISSGTSYTGCDLIYYSDSLQSGPGTNSTDKINYITADASIPGTFTPPVTFSQHPPFWSAKNHKPVLIEIAQQSDLGVAWVGMDGANAKIYWDRYSLLTSIKNEYKEIPSAYKLLQNYPNPFNPYTTIEYNISEKTFAVLKVFDIIGREISTLLNSVVEPGSYKINFNAGSLPSGIYFYQLRAGNYIETQKMILKK